MTVKDTYNSSYNDEFCVNLEYHLCDTFSKSDSEEIRRFWCDGVSHAPYYNEQVNKDYLDPKRVLIEKVIVTTAWLGVSGQDVYEMTIKLGKKAQKNYSEGTSLNNCLPSSDSMNWVKLDCENKKIQVSLL
ncbi:MAG: hypothetical protein MK105_16335 [Crocinitomicaceae bacterium]|nr:hypothetical protein [Crocinitomicaceae bacterium]